uniref:Uncharacterized protein n=1 Tax=Daphnia galeata TaxID=27404 RepID=A0A8J2RSM2_9CRUS|nr:unnamed protein product [Daphnia galeata]
MKKSSNISVQLLSSQYSGRGPCNITQVHAEVLSRYPGLVSQVAPVMKILQTCIHNGPPHPEDLTKLLDKFHGQLKPSVTLEAALNERTENQQNDQLAIVFNKEGGMDLLITVILSYVPYDSLSKAKFGMEIIHRTRRNADAMRIQKMCLVILRQLSILDPDCSLALSTCDPLLAHCFRLLKSTTLTETACDLIEHLLLSRNELVQLDGFKKLGDVLQQLDDETLSQTYRVLSLAVSDVDECENRASLLAQRRQKLNTRINEMTVSSLNRDFVVAIPGLLGKVLNYACSLPFVPRYPLPSTENEQWMAWIDENLSHNSHSFDTVGGFLQAVLEDVFRDELEMSPQVNMDTESFVADALELPSQLTRRVDALYLLSLLLTGSQRGKVQEILAKLGIGPLLSALFEQFLWKPSTTRHTTDHANQCNCSPEMILKIQLLRLVHNFCSHSTYKHVLLSYGEMDELKQLYVEFESLVVPTSTSNNSSSSSASTSSGMGVASNMASLPYCTGGSGLLSKIIRVLKNVPTSSIFRFWLCRAVESWLRSSSQYGVADQLFVINRGLLQHIVHVLLESESAVEPSVVVGGVAGIARNNGSLGSGPPREVAQSSFDLLGEMIRFNMEACRQLDILLPNEAKVSKYLEVVHGNLIDSNMFLRSVFLTMDHCMEGGSGGRFQQAAVFFPTSKFFSWFLHLRRRVCYLALLVSSISVDTLTLENVSCLNTALIILMLAARQGTLANCLKMLATATIEQLRLGPAGTEDRVGANKKRCLEPRHILSSLFQLLRFWRVHYQPGDQSCISLEKGSGIAFEEWIRTIDLLTSVDTSSPYSLLHYLPEDQSRIVQTWDIEMECS